MTRLQDLLAARRSTRRFDPGRDVEPDVLEAVLRAPLAMPHAGNTYDWRGIVLDRRARDDEAWPAVFEALLSQSYVAEAPVVIVWAVQPVFWESNFRRNVAELVERGLIEPSRHAALLELIEGGPARDLALPAALAGEAMMGVAAAMLVAMDHGLAATVTACRPAQLAAALRLPAEAVIPPFAVLAVGHSDEAPGRSAPKPPVGEMYYHGAWGRPLPLRG